MQLIKIALLLAPLIAAASAAVDDTHFDIQAKIKRDEGLMNRGLDTRNLRLKKRACDNNGCKCAKNTPQGVYCGLCEAVTESGKGGFYTRDSFECGPSGACCNYGATIICKSSNYASACPR